jgi:glyoxylase-like metal-dependent hydrolase (beta-lactamase superfamily II)
MKKIYPDLWQTAQEKLFGTLNVRSYILEHEKGNVMFYYAPNVDDIQEIKSIGGITHHFLSHCHEVNQSLVNVKEVFQSKLCCHQNVEPYLQGIVVPDLLFGAGENEMFFDDIEILYTPGHTSSNLCFYYKSPHGKSYLFTGDTLYLDDELWGTLIIPGEGGNKDDLIISLRQLRDLEVDAVICSVAIGENEIVEVTTNEWRNIINDQISNLIRS